jgi:pyruvate formate lyase activating enzyme
MGSVAGPTGLVFDIKRFAVHDGPGLRTVVFFKGCGLGCVWCHNPESIGSRPEIAVHPERCIGCRACAAACPNGAHSFGEGGEQGEHHFARERCRGCGRCAAECYAEALELVGREMTVDEVLDVLVADRAFYAASGGGITLSGGEPLVQRDFALALLRACRARGLRTALDTSGQVPWATLARALPNTDLVLYDLKHPDPNEHRRLTGATNELVLENLRRLSETGVPIEIRIPIVPGANDSPEVMAAFGRVVATLASVVAVRLLPYHRLAGSKYASVGRPNTLPAVDSPSRERLRLCADSLGLHDRVPIIVGE